MENLPEEIATEILSRLPAESILRCKVVCKSWYVLLTNPNFVSKHLANQYQSNNKLVLLKQRQSHNYELNDQKLCFLSNNDNAYEPEMVDLPSLFQLHVLRLIGHYDGLVAFSDRNECVIVCNPATREFRTLPNSSLVPLEYEDVATFDDEGCTTFSCIHFVGFGYDFKTDDYKIVRVITFSSYSKNGTAKPIYRTRTEVFCIRTDSCWREIDAIPDPSEAINLEVDLMEPCIDGVFYWRAKEDQTNQNVLISFHLADEVFRKTQMPMLECYDDYHTKVSVGVYNNSIALYICPCPPCNSIDIWVMREFGVKESWSKQLTIKQFMGVRHLGFWNGSVQKYLYVNRKGLLAVYDRVTRVSKMLSLTGERYSWTAVPYLKTIVSVKSREDIASACEKFHL